MRSLLDLDKAQLERIDRAMAALAARPAMERERKLCLLEALKHEKQELMRCNPAIRRATRRQAA